MDRVLDRLWIGSSEDFGAPLLQLGFLGVLDLRDSVRNRVQADATTLRLANRDGDPWDEKQIKGAFAFLHDKIANGKVLIACAAGMSRSASMTIGFLVHSGWGVAEAYERVKAARPRVLPVPAMLNAVLKVAQP